MNRVYYKFLFLPFLGFFALLFLAGFGTAFTCGVQAKGQKVSFYLLSKGPDPVFSSSTLQAFSTKVEKEQMIVNGDQKKLLQEILVVANHQWFFAKNADYRKVLLYQKIKNSALGHRNAFLEDYQSRKNNSFQKIVVIFPPDQFSVAPYLSSADKSSKKEQVIANLLFSSNLEQKKINLNQIYLQFTDKWLLSIQITDILIKKKGDIVKGTTKKYSSFGSLKEAKLEILNIWAFSS